MAGSKVLSRGCAGPGPRRYTLKVCVVEYTQRHAGGRRGEVAVRDWLAPRECYQHVNYGQIGCMASLVPAGIVVGRDAPALIRRSYRAARAQDADYLLFHQVD